jgi:hypothetical protein
MALVTNFKNFFARYVGGIVQAPEDIFTCPDGQTNMILGLDICNVLNTGIMVDVIFYDSSVAQDYYLVKNAPIPVGSSLQIISKQKQVLEEGDKIKVQANLQNAVDVVGCTMEVYTL